MSSSNNISTARNFIHQAKDISAFSAFVDGLSHEDRVVVVEAMNRKDQQALWGMAEGFRDISLDYFVAEGKTESEVIHFGKNTLPLFTKFQKRFYRPSELEGDRDYLVGYNWGIARPITGPGYYMAYYNEESKEVDINYYDCPTQKLADWPAIQDNNGLISSQVYGQMIDRMRAISEHVTIGSAVKKGKDFGSWFLLCRKD